MLRHSMVMHRIWGYEFLRTAIADNDYKARGCDISADEILYPTAQKAIPETFRRSSL